jgi:S1-C subfamily serine protease
VFALSSIRATSQRGLGLALSGVLLGIILGWSHTQAVISQLRTRAFDSRQVRIIQTQASINPGNSGGGLYDQNGYLLGINTWGADKSTSEGIAFAIALDNLIELAPPQLALKAERSADLVRDSPPSSSWSDCLGLATMELSRSPSGTPHP